MDDDIIFQILGNEEGQGGETENPNEDISSNENKVEDNFSLSKSEQEVKEQQEKEQLLKKKLEESKKAEESFIPNIPNPIDFVNYMEIEQSNTKISTAFSNFLIQNHRKTTKLKSVLEIEPHLDINKAIFTEKNRVIKSIYPKGDIIILCDLKGNIIFFSLKERNKTKELSFPGKLFSLGSVDDSAKIVNCLDITDEYDFLFVGYQSGTICVFDLKKNTCKYSVNKIHNNLSCIELKYSHREKNVFHILSCDVGGNVSYSILKDGTLGWRLVSTDKLIENKDIPIFALKFIRPIEYIDNIPSIKGLHQTAIFGAMDSIYIYSLEPQINEIVSIDKPDYIKENLIPDIQIGIGKSLINSKFTKTDDKNRLIMAIAWGRVITFYDLPIKDTFIIQPITLGNYVNEVNIIKCGFLSNSVLFLIDEKFTIKILNTRKVGYGAVHVIPLQKRIIPPKNNSDAELQNESLLDKNILTQKKITDPISDEEKDIYQYTIVTNKSSLFILCKNALYLGTLVDWKEFLNKLSIKEEYLTLFSIGIDTYQGKMNALLNIPNEDENRKKVIGDFLRAEISKYVIFATGSKKSGSFDSPEEIELIKKCMNISIELCLEIESFDYLIKKIEPMFESIEYGDFFLTRLEPFILYDRIKDVLLSEDIVKEIMDLYIRKEMNEVLSQLLLHINIKCIDTDSMKDKIKELNLISPIIYLYMDGSNEDYFAPITIMFQYFNSAEELINFTTYNEALETENINTVLSSKQYFGHKILWYLKLCLTGRKFPNNEEKMKTDLFNKLIPDITYWLITEKVMKVFLNFDPKDYFNILKNIFSLKIYHNLLVERASNVDAKIEITAQLLNDKFNLSDIEPLTLIENIVNYCRDKTRLIKIYLYDFVIISAKLNNINKKLRIEAVNFILSNYGDVIKDNNNQELNTFIKNIIEFIKNEEMFNDFDYTNILEKIKFDIFDEVKLYLLNKTKQYKKCLELFIEPRSHINNKIERLFNWIHDTHKTLLHNEKGLNDFKRYLIDNLIKIASINIDQFELMVKNIFPEQRKMILEKLLKDDKKICLEYIEALVRAINENLNDEEELDNIKSDSENISFILQLHIKLLCEFDKKDEILPALQKNHLYPFKKCINLCIDNNAYDATIYLYEISGDLMNAVNHCLLRIDDSFNQFLKDIDNNKIKDISEIKNNYRKNIEKYLNKGIEVCENNAQGNEDDIWFKILSKLFEYEKNLGTYFNKYKDNELNKSLIDHMQKENLQNIKDLMEKMCSYVKITRIINVVSERNKNAGIKEFRELIMKILINYSSQTNILSSTRNLLSELVFKNEGSFQSLNQEGEILDRDKCDKCQKEFSKNLINKEKAVVFNCKHILHKKCSIQEKTDFGIEEVCPICNASEIQKSSNKGKSLIKKQTVILDNVKNVNKEFQVDVSSKSQDILKKLKRFDNKLKAKKRISIENSLSTEI